MGSILKATDGVSKFEMPKEGVVVITFDDRKTTAAKIVKALEKGRFTIKGEPVYVKLGEPLQQGDSTGKNAPSPHGSSPGAKSQSRQGVSPVISVQPQELPLYI
ncbi:MAG: heavy-metal-associated domain-containing protein, partial [Syntrophales bacterium]|nr:heavy-metal-associated domain-containing protein [Syntrophales bacterium]